jgi:FtsH-binding integral membrane protein
MSYLDQPMGYGGFAAQAAADERAAFVTKTYLHLAAAVGGFIVLEDVLLNLPGIDGLVKTMVTSRVSWLIVLGLFMAVSYVADAWARSAISPAKQYAGLTLYVAAEAVIFAPLLYIAKIGYPGVITQAAIATLTLFAVLTVAVFLTRADFSFLRTFLVFGGLAALVIVVAAMLVGFNLGVVFTYAMIALACGYILYDTSNVMHHYRIGQHVSAALALFASLALLFWYILRLYMSRRD